MKTKQDKQYILCQQLINSPFQYNMEIHFIVKKYCIEI